MRGPSRLLSVLLVASLLAIGAAGPAAAGPGASPAAAVGDAADAAPPLPACRYRDDPTRYRKLRQWKRTLLDTNLKVGSAYRPRDLVPVTRAAIGGSGQVRDLVIDDLRALARAARRAEAAVAVRSAYRSYAEQVATFDYWVRQVGLKRARRVSARPGHSEHQLGTTIDFRSAASTRAPWDYEDWGATRPGRWIKRNAWKFGFLLSYPKGEARTSCYSYEPWHFRYVGRELARRVHRSGQVPRAFYWEAFEAAP